MHNLKTMEMVMNTVDHLRQIIGLLLFSAFISSVLCVYIYIKSKNAKNSFFLIIGQILGITWNVLYIFELTAPTLEIRWIIIVLEYIPICFLGVVLFHFAYCYTQNKQMQRTLFIITFIPPVIGYLSVLTNTYHYQFYKEIDYHMIKFGVFTYYIIGFTAIYLLLGVALFLFRKGDKNPVYRTQGIYYSIAILLPLGVHLLQIAGIMTFEIMVTLFFLPISMFILTVLILRYQFLDIIPSAIYRVIDNTMDGMLVVNNNGNIIDYNTSFFEKKFDMYDMKAISTIYDFSKRLATFSVEYQSIFDLNISIKANQYKIKKGMLKTDENISIYFTAKSLLDYRKQKVATLITFFDMTEIYMLHNELEIKNNELDAANRKLKKYLETVEKLTVEEEINRIMTEIHDTLGHSMTELLALIEVADILVDVNDVEALKTIQEAIRRARNSMDEIRLAVIRYKKMGGFV